MASGSGKSGDDDGDNPFTYDAFLKKNNKHSSMDNSDSDDAELASNGLPKPGTERASPNNAGATANDNPFSFRKFLVKDAAHSYSSPRPGHPPYSNNHDSDDFESVPDIASGLPDFVQDHMPKDYAGRGSSNGRIRSASELSLPDFVMGINDVPNTAESSYSGVFPSINAIGSLIGKDDGPMYGKNRRSSSGGGKKDSQKHSAQEAFLVSESDNATSADFDVITENRRLKEENALLRRQLTEARDVGRRESERVARLVQQVKTLQNHEAYETAALERMVQQVESNLESTTERAVKAESIVSKQKLEIRKLQEQLDAYQSMNGEYNGPMEEVKERTKYMSQQLAAAATGAESMLQQMSGGVQNLKLMSEIMLSIGKIYDDLEDDELSKNHEEKTPTDEPTKVEDTKPEDTAESKANSQDAKTDTKGKGKEPSASASKTKTDSSARKKTTSKSQKDSDKVKKEKK